MVAGLLRQLGASAARQGRECRGGIRGFSQCCRRGQSEVEVPHTTGLDRWLALSNKLSSKGPASQVSPSRLRGAGAYTSHASGSSGTSARKKKDMPPLPETRRLADSFVEMDLLFSKDEGLRETYVGGLSMVRMGRLMEDFDSLAGAAGYRYVLPDGTLPADASHYGLYLVTAAVDRIDLLRPLEDPSGSVPDLRLSGHVSYATTSSLEVFVRLSTIPKEGEKAETILVGRFAMACRKEGGGKHKIPVLEVVGLEEEEMMRMGKEMRIGKAERNLISLEKQPPSAEEAAMMHSLFVGRANIFERNAPTPPDVIWMSDTRINSALMMHPQERNVHSKIFGGYLMRLAYETAYASACLFARSRVHFLALDELRFALPVEIGSLLILDSRVTFAPIQGKHRSFHVSVEAGTVNLDTGDKRVTNTFHFTFSAEKELERYVLPRSYKQAMAWLDAQRRREIGIDIRKALEMKTE